MLAWLVDEELADQVWEAWDADETDDQVAWLAWWLIAGGRFTPNSGHRCGSIATLLPTGASIRIQPLSMANAGFGSE